MTWLVKAKSGLVQAGRGKHSDRTGNHTCLIGKNITEHVLRQDHVELLRISYQLHCTVVNQHMLKSNFRVILRYFFYYFSPKSGGIQNIRLVNACYFFAAFHGNVKCFDGNSANLVFVVGKGIDGFLYTVLFYCFSLAKIKTACKLSYDDHVKSVSNDLIAKWACCSKFVV